MSSLAGSTIGRTTIVCGWVLTTVAFVGIGFVLWARRLCHIHLEADDYLLIVAFLITVGLVAQITWAIVDDFQDMHVAEVPRTQLALIANSLLANETVWGVVNTLVRVSVLLLTQRIFGHIRGIRTSSWGLIALSLLYGLAIILEIFFICRPLAAAWDSSVNGWCGREVVSYVMLETFGLLIDLAILIVPLPPLWQLQMPVRTKLLLSCVFSLGAIVIVITGFRIQALHVVTSTDFTYTRGYLGLLSVLGALLSIIMCCALPIMTLVNKLRSRPVPSEAAVVYEITTNSIAEVKNIAEDVEAGRNESAKG